MFNNWDTNFDYDDLYDKLDSGFIASTANRETDILGFGEIGGVGQLIYHCICFEDYYYVDGNGSELLICPVCDEKHPPIISSAYGLTGKEILASLCNLARRIDDFEEEPYNELIFEWCKENLHPYRIDYLYDAYTASEFDIHGFDAELLAKDAIFSLQDFMTDLEKLYNTVRFEIALNAMCYADDDIAYDMYTEGRHFEAFPFFEKYKLDPVEIPDIDVSSAEGNLLKEMMLYNEYFKAHPLQEPTGWFKYVPYDDYDTLFKKLLDCFPDMRLRLKINPKTNKVVFSADVTSVFDIAWYTFARLLTEEKIPKITGERITHMDGIMACCRNCGRFYFRTASHQQYCNHPWCQQARNAKNQREYRKRKAMERAQAERKQHNE